MKSNATGQIVLLNDYIYIYIRHSIYFQKQSSYTAYVADLSLGEATASIS